jgi:uncharacterized protein YjbI with pentapeptide repeats
MVISSTWYSGSRSVCMALMTNGTDELKADEKSVNDAAGQLRVLWIAFITLATYFAIAVGSVTHRMLFLGTTVKLPVLNVDLPLVGFFVVAPLIFLVLHFHMLQQLHALTCKIAQYYDTLLLTVPFVMDRRRQQRRLDQFVFVSLFTAAREETTTWTTFLIKVVAFVTVVIGPLLLLLQIQITFLPYHDPWVTLLHRIVIVLDIVFIGAFWPGIRTGKSDLRRPLTSNHPLAIGGALIILIFSWFVATFPGEWVRHIPIIASPIRDVSDFVFRGSVNEVLGTPKGLFSNVLVLTDQQFIEADKLDKLSKLDRTISLRGRDLRGAVLVRADLRKADFTGANLNHAVLDFAKLSGVRMGCAETKRRADRDQKLPHGKEKWPDDGCTWLEAASLFQTDLEEAQLALAHLQNASLNFALLQGADLEYADLRGAQLGFALLQRASLHGSLLQGAVLPHAQLEGAILDHASMQCVNLDGAKLQGASLIGVDLEGASLTQAALLGSSFRDALLDGARLTQASVWRARDKPRSLTLATLTNLNGHEMLEAEFEKWRSEVLAKVRDNEIRGLVSDRISVLDPALHDQIDLIADSFWNEARNNIPAKREYEQGLAVMFLRLGCDEPFIARSLVGGNLGYRITETGHYLPEIAERFKNPDGVPQSNVQKGPVARAQRRSPHMNWLTWTRW